MYYLNDKHFDYEFCLYTRVGNSSPFLTELKYVNCIEDIYRKIEDIEKRHNHFRQIFYIDNDFYDNKYSINQNGTYYKFLRRPVNDWEEYNLYEENYNNFQEEYNNIFYFNNFKKFLK